MEIFLGSDGNGNAITRPMTPAEQAEFAALVNATA